MPPALNCCPHVCFLCLDLYSYSFQYLSLWLSPVGFKAEMSIYQKNYHSTTKYPYVWTWMLFHCLNTLSTNLHKKSKGINKPANILKKSSFSSAVFHLSSDDTSVHPVLLAGSMRLISDYFLPLIKWVLFLNTSECLPVPNICQCLHF